MSPTILYPLLISLPVGFLAIIVVVWKQFEDARGMKEPVNGGDKFLRDPGYSALKRVEKLNEEIDDVLFWFTILPAFVVVGYLALKLSPKSPMPYFWEIAVAIAAIAFVALSSQMISKIRARNNWRLGFRGERAVGEYLNRLMLDGCRVYHDIPLSENGNLDHVVVALSGVYAIETKTKRKCSHRADNHKVFYDGKKLEFPDWSDTKNLAQAREQAARLSRILTESLKMPIDVRPILTFPGWFVDNPRKLGEVQVLNPKMIRSAIVTNATTVLTTEQITKIAAYLDDQCRDVDF